MGVYFECDMCSFREPCNPNTDYTANCEDCGIDGCVKCLPDGLCDQCIALRDTDDEDDQDWDNDDGEAE